MHNRLANLMKSVNRIAVVCSDGVGDALIFMTLAHNLRINGYEAVLFSGIGSELQDWFPGSPMLKTPQLHELPDALSSYDLVFAQAHSKASIIAQKIGSECYVFDKRVISHPGSLVDKILEFCKSVLNLKNLVKHNGIKIPKGLTLRRHKNKIIVHPTSKDPAKNWPQKKFLTLARKLKNMGYEVVFVMSPKERLSWIDMAGNRFSVPHTNGLDDLARLLCEAGWMIGNDSGVGHLANNLGIPTLSIFSRKGTAMYWRPGWNLAEVIYPKIIIPGKLGHRHWSLLLTTRMVLKAFFHLVRKVSGEKQHCKVM